jgi:hypothetical protein
MRRNSISPEFKYAKTHGSMSMLELTSFFGSKMIDIVDKLTIGGENIIYYQTINSEQLNFNIEKNLTPKVYNTIGDKLANHTIKIDESQSKIQLESNTRWIIQIDLKSILINYLFATLKKYRTFEGVRNNMTIFNNIDAGVVDYINKNILSRYKYTTIDFFVDYIPFSQDSTMRYKNSFVEINVSNKISNKIQTIVNDNQTQLTLTFNQEKPSTTHNFNYYFNLYFEKI